MTQSHTLFTLIVLASILGGCSKNYLSPHKISVQQGNFVSQQMIDKLKPGMTKSQVKYVLGTPMLVDALSTDEWNYLYRIQHGSTGKVTQYAVKVVFENDQLVEVSGDYRPRPAVTKTASPQNTTKDNLPKKESGDPGAKEVEA